MVNVDPVAEGVSEILELRDLVVAVPDGLRARITLPAGTVSGAAAGGMPDRSGLICPEGAAA